MWLNKLFIEETIDFEKRCRTRIGVSVVLTVLGFLTILLAVFAVETPVLFLEPGHRDFVKGFYTGAGGGLMGAGIVMIIRNYRYLKNPELRKKRSIEENDERNRMLGLRTWAYAGYSMFLALYIGIVLSAFVSVTAMKVLLAVGAVYGLLLLIFRTILQKCM